MRRLHALLAPGHQLARLLVLLVLVDETAAQPPTHPRDLRGIERNALPLCHFDGDGTEFCEKARAAARLATSAVAGHEFGLIARADPPQLHAAAQRAL